MFELAQRNPYKRTSRSSSADILDYAHSRHIGRTVPGSKRNPIHWTCEKKRNLVSFHPVDTHTRSQSPLTVCTIPNRPCWTMRWKRTKGLSGKSQRTDGLPPPSQTIAACAATHPPASCYPRRRTGPPRRCPPPRAFRTLTRWAKSPAPTVPRYYRPAVASGRVKGKKRGLESTPQEQKPRAPFFISNLIPNANLLPVITAIAARARFIIVGIRCTVCPLVAIVTLPGAQAT